MIDALVWGAVGGIGIAIAWAIDAWAERSGRSRLLALLGLLPVLAYGLIVLVGWGSSRAGHAHEILLEVQRTERVAYRLASACGGMASAIAIAIMARWTWSVRGRWTAFDPIGVGLGTVLAFLGVGLGLGAWWMLAERASPDLLLLVSTAVLLAATVPGVVRHGPSERETADLRTRLFALSALSGALLALRFAGHMTELAAVPWWTVARPQLLPTGQAALVEGLAWGLIPALFALGAVFVRARNLAPHNLLPIGGALVAGGVMATPVGLSLAIQAANESVLDFAPVVGEVALPSHPDLIASPGHGCFWRWTPSGGELIPSQTRVVPTGCESLDDPAAADAFVAPADATLADLPIPGFDVDTLTLVVRTPEPAPYPYRVLTVPHEPGGESVIGLSLQSIVDRCHADTDRCDLSPWAASP